MSCRHTDTLLCRRLPRRRTPCACFKFLLACAAGRLLPLPPQPTSQMRFPYAESQQMLARRLAFPGLYLLLFLLFSDILATVRSAPPYRMVLWKLWFSVLYTIWQNEQCVGTQQSDQRVTRKRKHKCCDAILWRICCIFVVFGAQTLFGSEMLWHRGALYRMFYRYAFGRRLGVGQLTHRVTVCLVNECLLLQVWFVMCLKGQTFTRHQTYVHMEFIHKHQGWNITIHIRYMHHHHHIILSHAQQDLKTPW